MFELLLSSQCVSIEHGEMVLLFLFFSTSCLCKDVSRSESLNFLFPLPIVEEDNW